MASFNELWHGAPPQTGMSGYTPWIKAPSYDFSSKLYDYLGTMIGQPAPRWGGHGGFAKMAGQKNPFMNDVTGLASRYFNLGMPTVFGQAMGTLGRFANPSFANPVERIGQGYPNYFGYQAPPPQSSGSPWPWMQGGQ